MQADQYLAAWHGQGNVATWFAADSHAGGRNQDLVGPSQAPEPAGAALLAAGWMGLCLRRRRAD